MDAIVKGTKDELERKVRILRSLVRADKAKGDNKSLQYHSLALSKHEEVLTNM